MKILINNESIRNINKSTGTAVMKDKKANAGSPKSKPQSHPAKGSKIPRRINKAEQKERDDFKESTEDIRWIPHSKDGYVIAQFVKRDGKYSIYQPFDDSELFQISTQDKPKQKGNVWIVMLLIWLIYLN